MRATLHRSVTDRDMELSGPDFWPKIVADHVVDRFIFRRPELAYHVARRRMIEIRQKNRSDTQPLMIGIRLRRNFREGSLHRGGNLSRFGHPIDYTDDVKDVKTFTANLRRIIIRVMPDHPLLECALQLRFYDFEDKGHCLLSWQEPWL